MLTDLEKNAIRDHYQNIGKNLPGFRPRASQREMIAAVANAFSRTLTREEGGEPPKREGESIAVIEGPTGVGKSLAYLLSGGIMAQTRGKRLIVSSATVALQEQLVDRDLPFLVEKSGLELTFALAKGRGRYLCPYKLYQLTQSNAQQNLLGFEAPAVLWDSKPKPEELKLLRDIADEFSARRFNGDRDTWPEKIDDTIWMKVNNDNYGCLKTACPNRPECPFYLARDTLETVDVVVTNHDLLMVDISMGGGVILPDPENSFYCIDEAHHLPKKSPQPVCRRAFVEPSGVGVGKTAAGYRQNCRTHRQRRVGEPCRRSRRRVARKPARMAVPSRRRAVFELGVV